MIEKELPHNHGHISDKLLFAMNTNNTFSTISELFKLMSDDKRIQIFWILCHCEECVINISAILNISSSTVSHHLKILKEDGLVISRKDGKEVYYTVASTPRSQAIHNAIEAIIDVECPSNEIFKENNYYDSQVQIINEIHDYLINNLSCRYTIDDLASKFSINQTTLKATFKKTYGKSIGSYMKDYRIKKAMEYLEYTDKPISEISELVGYENQSKFTQVFKLTTDYLPKDYRKQRKEKNLKGGVDE